MPARLRKQTSKRSDEGTIGWPQCRTLLLASQDRELVAQQHDFDVVGELGPPTSNEKRGSAFPGPRAVPVDGRATDLQRLGCLVGLE
jgi:hypothetical protein